MRITVTNTIQSKRMERNLTQEELAHLASVTRQTIISIEKGNYTPSVLLALTLSQIFKLPVEELFALTDHK